MFPNAVADVMSRPAGIPMRNRIPAVPSGQFCATGAVVSPTVSHRSSPDVVLSFSMYSIRLSVVVSVRSPCHWRTSFGLLITTTSFVPAESWQV